MQVRRDLIAVGMILLLIGLGIGVFYTQATSSTTPKQSLLNTNAQITIPLQKALYSGQDVFYVTTEASSEKIASLITDKAGFPVTVAPIIRNIPSVQPIYVFSNGVSGSGLQGYQPEVFGYVPGQSGYTPMWVIYNVTWSNPGRATELTSAQQIQQAVQAGNVTASQTSYVVNCPFVKWPGGQLPVFNGTQNDNTPYGGGQVLNIDTSKMQVTFRAHRGWSEDGSTIAYIVTDTSIQGPANDMGVAYARYTNSSLGSNGVSKLWQFANGIKGSGPMGFQAGIGESKPGDADYSPFWSIQAVSWNDPSKAVILESVSDINLALQRGLITISPMMGGMIVNCPFVPLDLLH
jgi:hypothetical protein